VSDKKVPEHKNSSEQVAAVSYREAVEADFPVITSMYTELNRHFYATGYRLPHPENVGQVWLDSFRRTLGRFSYSIVAEIPDKNGIPYIVGFILARVKRVPPYMGGVLVGEVSDMWIVPEARRLGIGDKLSRLALDWLRNQGVHSVEIQVLRDNEASWKLYDRMGFKLEFRVGRLLWDEYSEEIPS
jgi:ribosomal protein S18 acetylase RimI-like enzyme